MNLICIQHIPRKFNTTKEVSSVKTVIFTPSRHKCGRKHLLQTLEAFTKSWYRGFFQRSYRSKCKTYKYQTSTPRHFNSSEMCPK